MTKVSTLVSVWDSGDVLSGEREQQLAPPAALKGRMERAMGIEPGSVAYKATALTLELRPHEQAIAHP